MTKEAQSFICKDVLGGEECTQEPSNGYPPCAECTVASDAVDDAFYKLKLNIPRGSSYVYIGDELILNVPQVFICGKKQFTFWEKDGNSFRASKEARVVSGLIETCVSDPEETRKNVR